MSNSVIEAFKGLNVASAQDASDHEAIFEVSYQYLSKIKNFRDLEAFHNCLVSLINSDKYYRALQLIDEVPEDVHREYPLEKAYVYYKTGKSALLALVYQAALETMDVNEVLLRGLKHVVAQSYYQTGNYGATLQLYLELIASNSVDGEVDLACNERAILSQIALRSGSAPGPQLSVSSSAETYDIVFNNALIKMATGSYAESMQLLEAALAQCTDQNLDAEPSDLMLEIAPIKLTIAYIHQLTGNDDAAVEVLGSLDLSLITDVLVQMLIKNNFRSLQAKKDDNENANFIARELDYQYNLHHLRQKLTPTQHHSLLKNHLLLSYQTNSLSKSSKYLTNRFYNEFSQQFDGDITPLIYKVLVKLDITLDDIEAPEQNTHIRRKLYKFASAELKNNTASQLAIAAAVLLVFLGFRAHTMCLSADILKKLVEIELNTSPESLHAGIFGLVFNVHRYLDANHEYDALMDAVWNKFNALQPESLQNNDHLYNFVRSVGFTLVKDGNDEKALQLLKMLHAARPEDVVVSSAVNGTTSALLPVESLYSSKSIEDLLAIDVDSVVPYKERRLGFLGVSKKKRPQKPKFSANKVFKPNGEFDAEKELNPERWLPLRLRSDYKPSKKELKKRSGGHQGAVESSPAPSAVLQSTTSSTKNKSKAKKKKGKK